MENRLPIVLENNANFVKLILGESTREIDSGTARDIISHLKTWLEWNEHWSHIAKYYKNYTPEKIDIILDEYEKGWGEEDVREYEIGENFANYLNISSDSGLFADNGKAAEIVKLDWESEFPNLKDQLVFDAESSYCYVYTSNREVAKQFKIWSYDKYIKGRLKDFNI